MPACMCIISILVSQIYFRELTLYEINKGGDLDRYSWKILWLLWGSNLIDFISITRLTYKSVTYITQRVQEMKLLRNIISTTECPLWACARLLWTLKLPSIKWSQFPIGYRKKIWDRLTESNEIYAPRK